MSKMISGANGGWGGGQTNHTDNFGVTTGNFNTAIGAGSLDLNQADSNTATGAAALLFNTSGTENTAVGTAALEFNDTGEENTAVGAFAGTPGVRPSSRVERGRSLNHRQAR